MGALRILFLLLAAIRFKKMSSLRTVVILILLMKCLGLEGQHLDSVELDLKHLSSIEFFKKYSLDDNAPSREDVKVTRLVWSLHHIRRVDQSLRKKGVKTVTIIDKRPSKENSYYVLGHYQLISNTEHMFRMSFYRVDISTNTIAYQSYADVTKKKWKSVN
jgi:hypothetical protein